MLRRLTAVICLLLGTTCLVATAGAQEGGAFSDYLVGTYDLRNGYTVLQVVNPTAQTLEVNFAFFDDNEKPLACKKEKLSHNDLVELDVRSLKLPAKFGVVKIISHRDRRPIPGIVGFQRFYAARTGIAESNLAAVPPKVLDAELKIILEVCK